MFLHTLLPHIAYVVFEPARSAILCSVGIVTDAEPFLRALVFELMGQA